MQSFYPERFEREMACSEADWLRWLPAAVGQHHWESRARSAHVRIGAGALALTWQVGAPRAIALVRMPRLLVSFRFDEIGEAERHAFMKRFDLYMQRGGG